MKKLIFMALLLSAQAWAGPGAELLEKYCALRDQANANSKELNTERRTHGNRTPLYTKLDKEGRNLSNQMDQLSRKYQKVAKNYISDSDCKLRKRK